VRPDGRKTQVDSGLAFPRALTFSSDQTLIYVADSASHWVYSYQVKPDGTLDHKQKYYWLHTPDDSPESGANSMCVDADGRLYVATRLGVQVCDQAGRVNCILPIPGGYVTAVSIAENTIYARTGDHLYSRKLKAHGAPAWATPVKPAAPRL
jgi:sugar lactone lactonase YvrE